MVAEVVEVDQRAERQPARRARGVDAPERPVLVDAVVEDARLDLHGADRDAVDPPVAHAQQHASAGEAAAHVRTLSRVDQAAGAISHLLTAEAQRRGRIIRRQRCRKVEERLLKGKLILVDRIRGAFAAALEGAVELAEQTDVRSEVEVAEHHVALQEHAVIVLRVVAPDRVVRVLVAFAHLAAE
jgi:hypothetical protein